MSAQTCQDDYIKLEQVFTTNGLFYSCQILIRYIDPEWKRYGYPHLTGDLRVTLNKAVVEDTCIHKDDVPAFLSRMSKYLEGMQALPADGLASSNRYVQTYTPAPTTLAQSRGCGCGRR